MIKKIGLFTAFIVLVTAMIELFSSVLDGSVKNVNSVGDNAQIAVNGSISNTTNEINFQHNYFDVEDSNKWSKYQNVRFGFQISYPNSFMRTEEPANGDGVYFISNENELILQVSAIFDFERSCISNLSCNVDMADLENRVLTNDGLTLVKSRGDKYYKYRVIDRNIAYTIKVNDVNYPSSEINQIVRTFKLISGVEAKR
ncbi:hypothetical protein ACQ902_004072 [Vibrio mimicus]